MSAPLIVFIVVAILLLVLLVLALRPPRKTGRTTEEILNSLSQPRHYLRLPQILQSLGEEDAQFLCRGGHDELAKRLRRERRRIALHYLTYLEDEYQMLLETSRVLAQMAPELSMMDEVQRLRLSLRFVWSCRYLRWRLRLGLQPWGVFGVLSDMAGDITLQLEAATARIGEGTARASNPLFLEDRGGESR